MKVVNERQRQWLLSDLAPGRVQTRGRYSYLEQWDVRRHLIRCFGPLGFEVVVEEARLVSEREGKNDLNNPNDRWTVTYLVRLRLTIFAADVLYEKVDYTAVATGTATNQPVLGDAHDHALKTAESDALKRAAINLGTQFGLSLYNNGSPVDVVKWTLDTPRGAADGAPETQKDDPVVEPERPTGGTEEPPSDGDATPGPVDVEVPEGIAYDLTGILDAVRATYSMETPAERIKAVAEIKMACPAAALQQLVDTKSGQMTLERVFDKATADAISAPITEPTDA